MTKIENYGIIFIENKKEKKFSTSSMALSSNRLGHKPFTLAMLGSNPPSVTTDCHSWFLSFFKAAKAQHENEETIAVDSFVAATT